MGTEIGVLVAKFNADTSNFDRGIAGVGRSVKNVTGVLGNLGVGVKGLENAFGGLGTRLQGVSTIATGLGGTLGVVGIGIGVVSAATVGLATALFSLVKSSAEVGGELFDLSQKTGVTVETLSGLSIVAKTTGSDINSLVPSLVIFQKNMEAATDASSKQGKVFKALSIDTRDNEKALRQAFAALGKMGEGSRQTALAMQLFGRSGKDVLAIVKETNGNLDEAIKRYAKMGLTIGTGAAAASDKFNDVLEETTLQLSAVTRAIGLELLPVATEALQSISASLAANKDQWSQWGTTISNVLRGARAVIVSEIGQMIFKLSELFVKIQPITWAIKGLAAAGAEAAPREDFFGPGGAARGGRASLPGTPEWRSAQRRIQQDSKIISPGGSRGGGGGPDPAQAAQRMAELQLEAVINGLRAEQDANKRALDIRRKDFNSYATQYMVIENRRHEAVIAGLDKELKAAQKLKKGREIALQEIANKRTEENTTHEENRNKVLDERAKILDQINDFIKQQEKDIASATTRTGQWDEEYAQLVETLKSEGVELEDVFRTRIENNIALGKEHDVILSLVRAYSQASIVRERFVTKAVKERPPWIDLGGGSTVGGEPSTTTRGRVVTADEQVMRDKLAKVREQMHQLGDDLTSIFGQSISDGFNNGIKSGLQTLAQGLLRIVEDVFLKRMAQGLGDMLSGIGTGSGGGFFGSLLKGILGGVSGGLGSIGGFGGGSLGGAGTSIAGAIGRDTGGPIWPNQLYKVHKDEYIMPTAPGFVIPKGGGGQQTIINKHYTIQLPPDSRGSYNSPRSKRQLSESLIAALEASRS